MVCFVVILVYFSRFGLLYQEKSGNPYTVPFQALPTQNIFSKTAKSSRCDSKICSKQTHLLPIMYIFLLKNHFLKSE
jgi:hypothetical protein